MNFNFIKTYKIILLSMVLVSCNSAVYKVKRCDVTDGIIHCSTASIKTKRELKNVKVSYEKGLFNFQSDEVTTNVSPLEMAGANALLKIIDQVELK